MEPAGLTIGMIRRIAAAPTGRGDPPAFQCSMSILELSTRHTVDVTTNSRINSVRWGDL
jgi:hypothetical protein